MSNRRHDTQSEREHWLAHFEKYPSTATSFCREHGLCHQTFLRWRRNARTTKSSTATPAPFIEREIPTCSSSCDENCEEKCNDCGVRGNSRMLAKDDLKAKLILFKWLNRRSQRRSMSWTQFGERLKHWDLPLPRIVEKPVQASLSGGRKPA